MSTSQITAILGFPLSHSLSPQLHAELYRQFNIDAAMIKLEEANLAAAIAAIKTKKIALTAVTAPHKQSIITYLDEVDAVAEKIGAVNTVVQINQKLYGYNTDIIGVTKALEAINLKAKKVLIIGAGGAAQAVAYYTFQQGAENYYYNRTGKNAQKLAEKYPGVVIKKNDLNQNLQIDIIINASTVGMFPSVEMSPIPLNYLKSDHIIFDLVYNPAETLLMRHAKAIGAKIIPGYTMFHAQALAQISLMTK